MVDKHISTDNFEFLVKLRGSNTNKSIWKKENNMWKLLKRHDINLKDFN